MAEEQTSGDRPQCPNCSSDDVAVRGPHNIRTASVLQTWECKKCGLVFASRLTTATVTATRDLHGSASLVQLRAESRASRLARPGPAKKSQARSRKKSTSGR